MTLSTRLPTVNFFPHVLRGAWEQGYESKAESVKREIYPIPTVDEIIAQLSGSKLFSKPDANSDFWQIPLIAKESQGSHHIHDSPWAVLVLF